MYAYAIYGTSIPVFIPVAEMVTMWLGLFVWLCELGVFVGCECKSAESEGDICTHSCVAVLVNKSTCNNLGAKRQRNRNNDREQENKYIHVHRNFDMCR